jgi:AcrR family transcriptional regulator
MQQRSEETRARILQAAAALFARNGYDATGVAQLCAQAGVSKGSFYHHFPSKQAVFLALLDTWLAALDTQMAEIVQGAPSIPQALVRMSAVTGSVFQSAGGQLPMFLEFWRESSHDPKVWEATIAPYRRYQQAIAALLRQGVAEGSLRPVDPERAARAIVGLAVGLILQGVIDPQGAAWAEVAQDALQWMMNGLSAKQA